MFSQMLKENGEFSLTRFLAFASFISFILVTIIIMIVNFYFSYDPGWYNTFATSTVGGTFIQPINKLINSKFNTAKGSYQEMPIIEGTEEDTKISNKDVK